MAACTISRSCMQSSHTAPATRVFLQLASRPPHSVLSFLAPRVWQHASPQSLRPIPKAASRRFSTTSARKETVAIYNPRKDENGQDINVEITPRASNRLREIMAKDKNPNLALRITVESGGCHGFQYLMSLTTLPPLSDRPPNTSAPPTSMPQESDAHSPALNTSSPDPNATTPSSSPASSPSRSGSSVAREAAVDEDDTVFKALDGSEAKVVMDGPSLELLKGSKIDYTMELIGSQFKIVDNPLATSSCGCGTSFDIKA